MISIYDIYLWSYDNITGYETQYILHFLKIHIFLIFCFKL